MQKIFTILLLSMSAFTVIDAQTSGGSDPFVLVIHGGAGTISKASMTPEKEKQYIAALTEALQAGHHIIKENGSSMDAIEAAILILEDSPLFNAGKGAVYTAEGSHELDASIMNGTTLSAGSVAGVSTIKNPILAARAVMEHSPHVMMSGKGAEVFAKEQGLEVVDPSYFDTDERRRSLEKVQEMEKQSPDKKSGFTSPFLDEKFGTVGAVARDLSGNLAAGTSTGGMTNKRFGRIGDSPVIGAGTYADNAVAAISCTGWGEYFIRAVAAYDVIAMMKYKGLPLEAAMKEVLKQIDKMGGDGGMIGIDHEGNIAMPFTTSGMYRGAISLDGKVIVEIYTASE